MNWIKEHYNVPADLYRKVIVDGRAGIIVKDLGNYIGVNFDDEKPDSVLPCHPTWKVEYLQFGTPRKKKNNSKSRERYQKYLQADWYCEGFGQWIKDGMYKDYEKGGRYYERY